MWLEKLNCEIKKKGQGEVAQLIGVSQPAISLWLKGTRVPSTKCILPLARLLSMKPESLLREISEE